MFIQHKSKVVNLNQVTDFDISTSTNNRFASRPFFKVTMNLSDSKSIEFEFETQQDLDDFLNKIEIIK